MQVVVAGADEHGIADAIDAEGHDVTSVDVADGETLPDADIEDADVYVLTEVAQATSIAVAKDYNPDVRVVVYAAGSLPEFATRQADLLIDPALLDPDAVAEELA
ncbi:MAG: CTP synthetase [Halorhabdus sp.]